MIATYQLLTGPAYLFRLQPDPAARPDWYVGAMTASLDPHGLATIEGLVIEDAWRGRRKIRIIDRAVDATLAEIGAANVRFVRRIDGRVGYYHRAVRPTAGTGQGQGGAVAVSGGDGAP